MATSKLPFTSKGQVSVELLVVFASLLGIYAIFFPVIAQTYQRVAEEVELKIQSAAEKKIENLIGQCMLLFPGSAFEQSIQLARNTSFADIELHKGANLIQFNRTRERCALTIIYNNS